MVLVIVEMAIFSGFQFSLKSIRYAKAKTTAVGLANQRMEELRNLPYDNLSTQGGAIYPHGSILDNEEITKEGTKFNIHTVINYVDDAFDGTAPADTQPADYKQLEISVYQVGRSAYMARLSTYVAAKAAETASNSGVIQICVVDADSNPLAGATVTVENTELGVAKMTGTVGADGCISIPNLPEDLHNHYHLTVTKDGYSTAMTYPRTSQNKNELIPDVNVTVQKVTTQLFAIDQLSNMNIHIKDTNGAAIANKEFTLSGEKLIYNNPLTPKYSQTFTTDASGNYSLTGMEFDTYYFSLDGYYVAAISPQPTTLEPGTTLEVNVTVTSSSTNPRVTKIDPAFATTGSTANVKIEGAAFANNLAISLRKGSLIINGTVADVKNDLIQASFDLTGAEVGIWDILIVNPNGEQITQPNGFEVK